MQYIYSIIIILISSNVFSDNQVIIQNINNQKCVVSNGTPNHEIGKFPNKANPNIFKKQKLKYCFNLKPTKNNNFSNRAKTVGITLTGIPIRPGTAGWYDSSSPRLHSQDSSSGLNLEAITPVKKILGIDKNNAHIDKRGLYHYHGMPEKLVNYMGNTLLGYAADGFEIHYLGKKVSSSWVLKDGNRVTEPYGKFDGSFLQDYKYVKGKGDLDECNGQKFEGKYVYFATDTFPFFPRCHWGKISKDFIGRGG